MPKARSVFCELKIKHWWNARETNNSGERKGVSKLGFEVFKVVRLWFKCKIKRYCYWSERESGEEMGWFCTQKG